MKLPHRQSTVRWEGIHHKGNVCRLLCVINLLSSRCLAFDEILLLCAVFHPRPQHRGRSVKQFSSPTMTPVCSGIWIIYLNSTCNVALPRPAFYFTKRIEPALVQQKQKKVKAMKKQKKNETVEIIMEKTQNEI